jgi:hypothetical protein
VFIQDTNLQELRLIGEGISMCTYDMDRIAVEPSDITPGEHRHFFEQFM